MRSASRLPPRADYRIGVGRMLLAAVILVVGLYAASRSLASGLRRPAPGPAQWLLPESARSMALRAEALAAGSSSLREWTRAADVGRAALLRDPLLPSAAATLGFRAALNGDDRAARRAFAYGQALSRRDLKTHLWSIEYAVSRGDVAGALRQYDLALRTSRQAPAILFPVLAGAAANDDVRRGLVPLLMRGSEWARPFVNHVANASPDHRSAATLFGELRSRGFAFPEGAEASMLGALVADRDYATARAYLNREGRDIVSTGSRTPRFRGNPPTPSPFDWNLGNDVGLTATIEQGNREGAFSFSAVAGAGGVVLRQLQLLRPGRYVVASHLAAMEPADASAFWIVQCVDGAELARLPTRFGQTGAPSSNRFTVSAACPAQWLTYVVAPNDSVGGVTGQLAYAQIRSVER